MQERGVVGGKRRTDLLKNRFMFAMKPIDPRKARSVFEYVDWPGIQRNGNDKKTINIPMESCQVLFEREDEFAAVIKDLFQSRPRDFKGDYICPDMRKMDKLIVAGDFFNEEFSYVKIGTRGCVSEVSDCLPEKEVIGEPI
jgi:hypothetical protein